jgi:hypothetical protein
MSWALLDGDRDRFGFAWSTAQRLVDNALRVLDDPDPALLLLLRRVLGVDDDDEEEDDDNKLDEAFLSVLLGTAELGWSADETRHLLTLAAESRSRGGLLDHEVLLIEVATAVRATQAPLTVAETDKAAACAFIRAHHSHLPECNPRGLLYAIEARWQGRRVAVATAGTPTGRWGAGDCPPEGILELTRVAAISGLVRRDRRGREVPVNASSALTSRLMDLLPAAGRGCLGCLFITYSLATERGTTYRSLVSKGLRPVARVRGRRPSGARRGASSAALHHLDKVRWEAGPAAGPPDWSLLEDPAGVIRAWEHRRER